MPTQFGDLSQVQQRSRPALVVRSAMRTRPAFFCLRWSTPNDADNPNCWRQAVTRAEPAQNSMMNGSFALCPAQGMDSCKCYVRVVQWNQAYWNNYCQLAHCYSAKRAGETERHPSGQTQNLYTRKTCVCAMLLGRGVNAFCGLPSSAAHNKCNISGIPFCNEILPGQIHDIF
jgi:hypothetical protein